MRGFEFTLQVLHCMAGREKEVTGHAQKVAVDLFVSNDLLNFIDGRPVALRGESCALLAVQPFEFYEAIIQREAQMGGGAAGLATRDDTVVQNGDV